MVLIFLCHTYCKQYWWDFFTLSAIFLVTLIDSVNFSVRLLIRDIFNDTYKILGKKCGYLWIRSWPWPLPPGPAAAPKKPHNWRTPAEPPGTRQRSFAPIRKRPPSGDIFRLSAAEKKKQTWKIKLYKKLINSTKYKKI